MASVIIGNQEIQVKEYKKQRVITFKNIDRVHKRPEGTARKRFNDNKKHLIENEDYFVRKMDEAKNEYGIIAPNGLVLLTESGYLMLVKSFTDDLAWEVQRKLVNSYFRVRETEQSSYTTVPTIKGSKTSIPKNGNWYDRVKLRIDLLCELYGVNKKKIYHYILTQIQGVYN